MVYEVLKADITVLLDDGKISHRSDPILIQNSKEFEMRHSENRIKWEAIMLKIIFGNCEEAIYNTAVYFKNTYQDEWITDVLSVEMIKDVDQSVVIGPHMIESPVMGAISPKELSGGVKTLILVHKDKSKIFNASTCGDNCAKWLLKLGETDDIVINLRHIMDFGNGEFEIEILNTNQIVRNMNELVDIAGMFI